MSTQTQKEELEKKLQERFAQLPKVVRDAVASADVEQHLRDLANIHKLHLDQWEKLENEMVLALLGFQQIDNLQENIKNEVHVDDATAAALAADISRVVFEPIREELERMLEHPEAKEKEISDVEAARAQVLAGQPVADNIQQSAASSNLDSATSYKLQATSFPVVPATPPPPPPATRAERGPASGAYKSGEPSIVRKSVEDDPYREPPK